MLIYCRDHRCSHHVETNADAWANDIRLMAIFNRCIGVAEHHQVAGPVRYLDGLNRRLCAAAG